MNKTLYITIHLFFFIDNLSPSTEKIRYGNGTNKRTYN